MAKVTKTFFPVFMALVFCIGLLTLTMGCAQKPPTITKVEPTSGPSSGGTAITITGKGFKQNDEVTVGGAKATVTKVTPGATATIAATTPAGSAGTAAIVVKHPKAKQGSMPFSSFSYYDEVKVASTDPDPAITPELEAPISKISATFNVDVDPTTVKMEVADAAGAPVEGKVSQDPMDTKKFTFDTTAPLKAGQSYKVTVSDAKGTIGENNILVPSTIEFKIKEGAKPAKGAKAAKKK
jgi:hypothetical protein